MSPYLAPGVFEDNAAYRRRKRAEARATIDTARRTGLFAGLPASRQRVLDARWPEGGGPPTATLADLADELGLSRERIRQIENQALKTLQASPAAAIRRLPARAAGAVSRCEQGYGWPMSGEAATYDALTPEALVFADERALAAGLMRWPRP